MRVRLLRFKSLVTRFFSQGENRLMIRRYSAFGLLLLGIAALCPPLLAETRTGGQITGDVRWTKAGSPYIITSDVEVVRGARLTIEPGVVVRFKPNLADQKGIRPFDMEVAVHGTLEAVGADNDTIFFTSDAVEPQWTDWAGIIVVDRQARVTLSQVAVEFAHTGVQVQEGRLDISRSAIRYCNEKGINVIRGSARIVKNYITGIGNYSGTGKGINLIASPDVEVESNFVIGAQTGMSCERGSHAKITNNLFSLCKLYGLTVTSSNPQIIRNNITQNEFGLALFGGSAPKVRDNNIFENGSYDLKIDQYKMGPNNEPVEIDVSGNWWGYLVNEIISDKVEDAYDNPVLGAVARLEPIRKDAIR
jgi:parallel beta-helix repeat protein